MISAKIVESVAAPADAVWQIMSNFAGIEPNEMIAGCTTKGEGVGAVRTIALNAGGEIIERLESLDNDAREFSYAIINDSPLPVKNYVSTVKISDDGSNATRVDWSSVFDASGAPDEQVIKLIEGVYQAGIARARSKLGL